MRFALGMSCAFHAEVIEVADAEGTIIVLGCCPITLRRTNRAFARIKGCVVRHASLSNDCPAQVITTITDII